MDSKEHSIPANNTDYKPLRDIIYESIRDAIIKEKYKPGDRILENRLAQEIGVSRTPVREAIHKLILEGYATVTPRRGIQIARISLDEIDEVYEIRAALEALAAGLAAEKATREQIEAMKDYLCRENPAGGSEDAVFTLRGDLEIHDLIYRSTGNQRLRSMLLNLWHQSYRWRVAPTYAPENTGNSLNSHRKIIESIIKGDILTARQAALAHVEFAQQNLTNYLTAR